MIRPSLVCKYIGLTILLSFLVWLILPLLWFVLPFPEEDPNNALYQLLGGSTYTRVFETSVHWPYYDTPVDRHYFALNFTLHGSGTDDAVLTVGGQPLRLDELFLKDQIINATVKTADPDGIYLPSWPHGDCTLLHQIIEPEETEVPVLLSTDGPTSSVTQLWIKSLRRDPDLTESDYLLPDGTTAGSELLMRLSWTQGALAEVGDFPAQSWGLSKTFKLRNALLKILAPSSLLIWACVAPVMEIVGNCLLRTVHWIILLIFFASIAWLCLGRPPLEAMLGVVNRLRPSARLEKAIQLTIDIRAQKIERKRQGTVRTSDIVFDDVLVIWRESGTLTGITSIRDFDIFDRNKDSESP